MCAGVGEERCAGSGGARGVFDFAARAKERMHLCHAHTVAGEERVGESERDNPAVVVSSQKFVVAFFCGTNRNVLWMMGANVRKVRMF